MKEYKTKHKVIKFGVVTTNGNIYDEKCMENVIGKKGKLAEGVFCFNEEIPLNKLIGRFSVNNNLTVKFTVSDEKHLELIKSLDDGTFEDRYRIVLTVCGEVEKIKGRNIVTKINNIESANLVPKEESSWEKNNEKTS